MRLAKMHTIDTIMQIAMLTSDDISSHGSQRNDPPDADPIVARFFAEEREVISGDASLKRIDRVAQLGTRFKPPITIEAISETFRNDRRGSYFDAICEQIERADRSIVAFVDPDTGISIGRPSDKHITEEELNSVWSELRSGSALVAFQYQQRGRDWINDSRQRFARALDVNLGEVGDNTYLSVSVSFVFARKWSGGDRKK